MMSFISWPNYFVMCGQILQAAKEFLEINSKPPTVIQVKTVRYPKIWVAVSLLLKLVRVNKIFKLWRHFSHCLMHV